MSTVLMIYSMRINFGDSLRSVGVDVAPVARSGRPEGTAADVLVQVDGARFAVERRGRLPYPNEMPALEKRRAELASVGTPLLSVPFVPVSAESMLRDAGWSWADDAGNFDLRAPGLLLRQRLTTKPPVTGSTHLPQGSGSTAIIRALIGFSDDETEEPGVGALASQAGVSQPRASQVLSRLHELGLVERIGRGRWRPARAALLDRFLADYRGPGGTEQHYYSLDPLSIAAAALAGRSPRAASETAGEFVVSADVGPDLISAWRRPTTLIVYCRGLTSPETSGLVRAQGRGDANVVIRQPADTSVFPVPELVVDVDGVEVSLADPTQMIWDLHDLGGQDRVEAAGVMREWLLNR
jgi:hypothetical protein